MTHGGVVNMSLYDIFIWLFIPALLMGIIWYFRIGPKREPGRVLVLIAVPICALGIWWVSRDIAPAGPTGKNVSDKGQVAVGEGRFETSGTCAECHREQYDSWYKTFHRTMTREATPENVKGDFNNATLVYQGVTSRMTREGDSFFMETGDPQTAWRLAQTQAGLSDPGKLPLVKLRVDRVVGSHFLQECLHQKANGEFERLPIMYHLGEKKWVHSNGSFLAPDSEDFWSQSRGAVWNETCLFCHNTGTQKNPVKGPKGNVIGYKTTVHELGISCEACHGPGGDHVEKERSPGGSNTGVATDVVNPARLSVARRDDICARCHGAIIPNPQAWDFKTHRDPFVPGLDLGAFNHFFWSEKEQHLIASGKKAQPHSRPEPDDGRFWGDGTPLTTSLEFNGMALSGCYQNGKGAMSCLSCHTMHGNDPNFLLKPDMGSNEACYQCHQEYRTKLAQHTRHGVDSSGSQCASCHMPHQVYSLMGTHVSHRIQIPDLKGSIGTGKPHACNLCHLDKSLGWTKDELAKWPNGKKHSSGQLSPDEKNIASSILVLAQGDARSRVIFAGAFSKAGARKASGDDWYGLFLTRLMQPERYPAVRYLTHKALQSTSGGIPMAWDTLGRPEKRAQQLQMLSRRFDASPLFGSHPNLPLGPNGLPDEAVLKRLFQSRSDPDLTVNE